MHTYAYTQIKEMEQELSQYHQSNGALKLMISEIKLKITGMTSETELQSKGIKAHDNFILKFQVRMSLDRTPTRTHTHTHTHTPHTAVNRRPI